MHCLSALTLGVFAVILCRPCAATSPIGEPLHWTSTGPLIAPIPDAQHPIVSVKDPTVVHHNAKWHVYATTADTIVAYPGVKKRGLTFANAGGRAP